MARSTSSDMSFVRRAVALWDDDAQEVGYHPRLFCQLALPYQDPGTAKNVWSRRNGDRSLQVRPGYDDDEAPIGYPYGTIPRLLLSWLATEATRTGKAELQLGENLSDFMRQIGLTPTGGKNGTITRLHSQVKRLFNAVISVKYHGDASVEMGVNLTIAAGSVLWWSDSDRNSSQRSLLPSTVWLSSEFFNEIVEHPVPVSLDALRELRGSPIRLDIYTWLTHRMSYLKGYTRITWDQLQGQFGSNVADNRFGRAKFRALFERHLAYVLVVYPEARVEVMAEGVILRRSPTHIAPRVPMRALPAAGQTGRGR